ncbi:AfsR/SARP family transcriptional regulator [Streptosporangium sandarakinum]|uniref:AfsR/SARP family transcriptional regulator n=1 Tax=Streptosporangium sandarakinum TaxID=1260955 RepID=UPI0033810699
MEIRILGQLEAWESGTSVLPTAGKPRQILALLALNRGQVVTAAALAEELWNGNPPRSASTTLQTYILQLRRKLDSARGLTLKRTGKDVLVTRHIGYQLQMSDVEVDAWEHERLVAAGRRAVDEHDDARAAQLLSKALNLWRGAALVDVPTGPLLELEVMRLEHLRLCAAEMRIEAELRLGRHQTLLGDLAVLCAQHPLNENLQIHYMLALYRSGRQWQALTVYRQLRHTLDLELGVEPCPRAQQMMRAITASDPTLDQVLHPALGRLVG